MVESTYMCLVNPSHLMQFKNALDHSMTKGVKGLPICMLCCSFNCCKTLWAVEWPPLLRVNAKLILTPNDPSKSNLIFLMAVNDGVLDSMEIQIKQILRCVHQVQLGELC